jgi:tripartite-type tricarboxylate transporter receptor subunit TctC
MKKLNEKLFPIVITVAAVLITAAVVLMFWWERNASVIPEQIVITVAWNPGSVSDDIARVMAGNINSEITQAVLQNITGANGANALNAVYNAPHDGTHLLSTSLSAFFESERMGFAESSRDDWTWWIVAYSPAYDDYYGLFVPAATPQPLLRGLENLITDASSSDTFAEFLEQNGLVAE